MVAQSSLTQQKFHIILARCESHVSLSYNVSVKTKFNPSCFCQGQFLFLLLLVFCYALTFLSFRVQPLPPLHSPHQLLGVQYGAQCVFLVVFRSWIVSAGCFIFFKKKISFKPFIALFGIALPLTHCEVKEQHRFLLANQQKSGQGQVL